MANDNSGRMLCDFHGQHFLRPLKSMYDQERFTDVTILCRGQVFKAHRVVLSAYSGHFDKAFEVMDRAGVPSHGLIMNEPRPAALRLVMDFIYLGCVDLRAEDYAEFERLAKFLELRCFHLRDEELFAYQRDYTHHLSTLAELKKRLDEEQQAPAGPSQSQPSRPKPAKRKRLSLSSSENEDGASEDSDYVPEVPKKSIPKRGIVARGRRVGRSRGRSCSGRPYRAALSNFSSRPSTSSIGYAERLPGDDINRAKSLAQVLARSKEAAGAVNVGASTSTAAADLNSEKLRQCSIVIPSLKQSDLDNYGITLPRPISVAAEPPEKKKQRVEEDLQVISVPPYGRERESRVLIQRQEEEEQEQEVVFENGAPDEIFVEKPKRKVADACVPSMPVVRPVNVEEEPSLEFSSLATEAKFGEMNGLERRTNFFIKLPNDPTNLHCSFPNCNFTLPEGADEELSLHEMKHAELMEHDPGLLPFACDKCEGRYPTVEYFDEHMVLQHRTSRSLAAH